MAERPSGATISLGKPGGIGLVSRIGGAERGPVSSTASFSPFRSEGGKISTSISFGSLGKESRPSSRFARTFAPSISSGERSAAKKPTPIKSGPTVSGLPELIAKEPYTGMFGRASSLVRTESTPVSLVKEPRSGATTRSVEPARSFIKRIPGGDIVPQRNEVSAPPKRAVYYPTWTRPQPSETTTPITEVRNVLREIPVKEKVSLEKVAPVEKQSINLNKGDVRLGDVSQRPLDAVRADIKRLANPWTPKNPDIADLPVQPNRTLVSTGKIEKSPYRGSAFLRIMREREEQKKAKVSGTQNIDITKIKTDIQQKEMTLGVQHTQNGETAKQAQTPSAKITENTAHLQSQSVNTQKNANTSESPVKQTLRERVRSNKNKIKSMLVSKLGKKQSGEGDGKYIVDTEAQQARENSARSAIEAADKGTGIVDGREVVALMGAEPTNAMVSGLLKMIGVNVANKQVDGSYAKLTKMIASIGFVEKKVARRAVKDGVASYRAVAYTEEEGSSRVTDREVDTVVQGGKQSDHDLAA